MFSTVGVKTICLQTENDSVEEVIYKERAQLNLKLVGKERYHSILIDCLFQFSSVV